LRWAIYLDLHDGALALGILRLIAAVAAVGICLLGFEKLRAWGAILVGEAEAKNQARRISAEEERAPEEASFPTGAGNELG
jgi:hypothetical protein